MHTVLIPKLPELSNLHQHPSNLSSPLISWVNTCMCFEILYVYSLKVIVILQCDGARANFFLLLLRRAFHYLDVFWLWTLNTCDVFFNLQRAFHYLNSSSHFYYQFCLSLINVWSPPINSGLLRSFPPPTLSHWVSTVFSQYQAPLSSPAMETHKPSSLFCPLFFLSSGPHFRSWISNFKSTFPQFLIQPSPQHSIPCLFWLLKHDLPFFFFFLMDLLPCSPATSSLTRLMMWKLWCSGAA